MLDVGRMDWVVSVKLCNIGGSDSYVAEDSGVLGVSALSSGPSSPKD